MITNTHNTKNIDKRNMKEKIFCISLMLLCLTMPLAAQNMSDKEVLDYAKSGLAAGKSQTQIGKELIFKGVTREQVERIKKELEDSSAGKTKGAEQTRNVMRKTAIDITDAETDSDGDDKDVADDDVATVAGKDSKENSVFGRNIFQNKNLTFEPSMNIATPQDYRLGPGDEVIIEVWGASEANVKQTITPDGYINIEHVGPISLNGLTVIEASSRIKERLSKIYAGLNGSKVDISTEARVSIGQIRTIQINVMGEVSRPGTYAVSSFATVFHALYKAGGMSDIGSLRDISLVRGGRTVAHIDVYDYIIRGRSHDDTRLQEGDVVLVAPYAHLVRVKGNVRRPMYYEMKSGECLQSLIDYAGGFSGDAYSENVAVDRKSGKEMSVSTVNEMDYGIFQLKDGDIVSVGAVLQRYTNRVKLSGAVYRDGFYELGKGILTVKDLVTAADGLMDDAFTNRAVLHREREDRSLEVIPVDIGGIMSGKVPDIALKKNDALFVPSVYDLQEHGKLEIFGDVAQPGMFPYADNTTLEDLIIQAGGLLRSASTVKVDISRRIVDSSKTNKQKEIAQTFTFGVKEGFVVDGKQGFLLKPNDQVFVRRSPVAEALVNVVINGEVEFEGTYTLTERNERLSDLIAKAGGVTKFSYIRGARLERRMTDDERRQARDLLETVLLQNEQDKDSVNVSLLEVDSVYTVAIDLEKALNNPHSDYDVVLNEGDKIFVPKYNNTVKVGGTVRKPNTITYNPGKGVGYYISEAGGFGERARKSGIYILYQNGHISKVSKHGKSSKIEPGCQIIVPQKHQSKWSLGTSLQTITTSVSMLAVIASLINTMK